MKLVKCTLEVPIEQPAIVGAVLARAQSRMAVLDGILTAAARTEALAVGLKASFPAGL